jgi:signal transduction histidine kinase
MARELELRKNNLLETLDELSSSRKAVIAEKNFKESILDSISSAILTFSHDGRLTSVNGTAQKFLTTGAVPGRNYQDVFADWGDMPNRTRIALTEGAGYGRSPLVLMDGKGARHFEVGFFPISAEAGGGITVTMRDETEKEMLREEMTRMDRLASLGKLAAGIAHEVRNPLTGISLLLDDLHDRAAETPDVQAMMGKALAEIERVERLVAALLRYASPAKPQFMRADINKTCEDILFLLSLECERKEITLIFQPGEIAPFVFDPEKIKQAVLNIVKNAMEAVQKGGYISVVTGMERDSVIIRIVDDGPGILETDLPLIFEPFFTRKGAGTGLGLSITQQIVHEHHGELRVSSYCGSGTEIALSLPFRTDE